MAIVCFTDDAAHADEVSRRLAERFEFVGIDTKLRLTTGWGQREDLQRCWGTGVERDCLTGGE